MRTQRNTKPCNRCGRQIYFMQALGHEIKTKWTVYDAITNAEHKATCYKDAPKFAKGSKILSRWSKGVMFYMVGEVDTEQLHYVLYYLGNRGSLRSNRKPIKMIDSVSRPVGDVDKLLYDIPSLEKYTGIITSDDEIPF